MHYIVNPWFFYLMDVCEFLDNITKVSFIISIIGAVCLLIGYVSVQIDDNDDEIGNKLKKWSKFCFIVGIISCLLAVFIPSKDTCEKMIISSLITEENIDAGKEEAKELIDYVFEKIDELNSGE